MADLVLAALGKPASLKQHVRDRLGHDRRYAVNTAKLSALDWHPQISLERGLRDTVNWYRDNEAWWRPLKSGEFWDFYRRNYKPLQAEPAPGL